MMTVDGVDDGDGRETGATKAELDFQPASDSSQYPRCLFEGHSDADDGECCEAGTTKVAPHGSIAFVTIICFHSFSQQFLCKR